MKSIEISKSLIEKHFNGFLDKLDFLDIKYPDVLPQWDYEKNEKEGVGIRTYKTNVKCTPVWWKCIECNHSYKVSIFKKNKSNSSDCPACNFKKTNIGEKILKYWNIQKNGVLNFIPKQNDFYWFKFEKCGHEYYSTYRKIINTEVCRECLSIKQAQLTIEKKAKEVSEKALLKGRASLIERKLYYFMYMIFGSEVKSGYQLRSEYSMRPTEIDIYVEKLKLGIEYDGVFYHRDKLEKDISKNELLNKKEIKLLRIREEGLQKISEYDIVFPKNKYDINFLVKKVIAFLIKNYSLSPVELEGIKNINNIEDLNSHSIPEEFRVYPFIENSISHSNKTLEKDWDYSTNYQLGLKFTLKSLTESSRKISTNVAWKCQKCKFRWIDSIVNRLRGSVCIKCNGNVNLDTREFENDKYNMITDINKIKTIIKPLEQCCKEYLEKNSFLNFKKTKENINKLKELITMSNEKLCKQKKFFNTGIIEEIEEIIKTPKTKIGKKDKNESSEHNKCLNYAIDIPQYYYKENWYVDFSTIVYLTKIKTATLRRKLVELTYVSFKEKNIFLYNVKEVIKLFPQLEKRLKDLSGFKPEFEITYKGECEIQILWNEKFYVKFTSLIKELNISKSTLFRDIKSKNEIQSSKIKYKSNFLFPAEILKNFWNIMDK